MENSPMTAENLSDEIAAIDTPVSDREDELSATSGPKIPGLLRLLASLKITVVLFAMAIFIVLAGTLAQVHKDIWEVVRDYFRTDFAWIEFRVFFPKSFFMGSFLEPLTDIPEGLGLPFPGGWMIGGAMAINLLAAHAIRFKVQVRGQRLVYGILTLAAGCALTTVVILWGSMQSGQENPLFQEWPSLRILFQLFQGGLAGGVLLAGCIMVFRRRAGIVLLHAGVLLLMFSELLVGLTAIEGQMSIREGETVNFEQDVRAVELAIIDQSDTATDRVTVVPLTEEGVATRFLDGETISHEDLPFDIEVDRFLRNSQPPKNRPQADKTFEGSGRFLDVEEARPGTGTDTSGSVDVASIVVTLKGKPSGSLGRWLFSQHLKAQDITVDGKTYEIDLRFKRSYVPYSLHLVDVRDDKYIGTQTARNYSSDVRLLDDSGTTDRMVHIWMNNPLRFAGKTFYQSSVDPQAQVTGLQVVTNTGWMIPYVACMVVAIGMAYQFMLVLIRFQRRRSRGMFDVEETDDDRQPRPAEETEQMLNFDGTPVVDDNDGLSMGTVPWYRQGQFLFPLIVVVVTVLWLGSRMRPPKVATGEPNVHALGRLPVVYQGRVKPFDTLARNSLRVISGRNTYRDAAGNSQPAIHWLLDEMANSTEAGTHKVFRIENFDVLDTLGLSRRKGFRYSYREFQEHVVPGREAQGQSEYRKQVAKAIETPSEQMTVYQRKLRELHNRIQQYQALRAAHKLVEPGFDTSFDRILSILRSRELTDQRANLPLSVPSKQRKWQALALESLRAWIRDAAREWKVDSPAAVATELVRRFGELRDPDFERIVRDQAIDSIIQSARQQGMKASPAEMLEMVKKQLEQVTAAEREELLSRTRGPVLERLTQQVGSVFLVLLGETGFSEETPVGCRALENIFQAWKAGDAGTFAAETESLRKAYSQAPPEEYNATRAGFEHHFNGFEPFYLSIILYGFVFLLVAGSWLGWTTLLNRTAGWLVLLIFVLHTYGLVSRVYISGKPPVTNLYSSAVFIGWGAVVAGIIIERMYKMGIGNVIAAISGFATLIIAQNLAGDGDTFTVLAAVLDTQFWLATHVVCITLGYTGTYVAGLLGALYILRGVLTPSLSQRVGRNLARAVYGTTCAAMFFSFVGTVLGGLWADDSWGRFWGWDPKENGALIIVLFNALVLHARWDGLVKDRGLAALAVLGNIVVSWSWFGVNELGVGLHSYGFTEGVMLALGAFCASQLAIAAMGCLPRQSWWSERANADKQASAETSPVGPA
jgi:ABC-type transport system involved in cytochrome c biogenesis permease subunit